MIHKISDLPSSYSSSKKQEAPVSFCGNFFPFFLDIPWKLSILDYQEKENFSKNGQRNLVPSKI